LFVINAY